MKLKKLRSKMLISILPVIILGILIIVTISGIQTKNLAYSEISNYMFAELKARNAQIENSLERVDTTSTNLAKLVGATYSEVSMETYLKALEDIINSNDFILGSGLWFEPNIYDKNELYMGPYVYTEEVFASVNLLTTQTTESKKMSNEIKSRANKIGISSKSSYTHAKDLTIQYESSLLFASSS